MIYIKQITTILILVFAAANLEADSVEDIVQQHEMTLAEMACFSVDVLVRPSDRPWGTEFDVGYRFQRSGNDYKFTITQPGTMTDSLGNNPVPGQYWERFTNDSGTRSISYPQEFHADIEKARESGARVMKGDRAYLSGEINPKRTPLSTALVNPVEGFTLPELLARATDKQLVNAGELKVIKCKIKNTDYSFSFDPKRKFMIVKAELMRGKNEYSNVEWVKDWIQINDFWLPTEVEIKTSRKVGNVVSKFSDWQFCDSASSPLELKFLTGSRVTSPGQMHFWGENDQPEASFPLDDEQAWKGYENRMLAKYGRSTSSSGGIRVFGIVAFAATLLAGGYWLKNRQDS